MSVGTDDLAHNHHLAAKVRRDPGTAGRGALNAEPEDVAEGKNEAEEFHVTAVGGGKLRVTELLAEFADHGDVVRIGMRIDAGVHIRVCGLQEDLPFHVLVEPERCHSVGQTGR